MATSRPSFRKPKSTPAYDSPEELFSKLPNRAQSHGYLRGPQQDALRAYIENKHESDIALELPTGTGKTTVGLMIAEWRRRQSRRPAAYLTLTNQLAGQVLKEAKSLGLSCADLRGTKDTRDRGEEGRFRSAEAIGVTTYSNLLNSNPVIKAADLLVLDDAHGGEQYVADMWTVKIGYNDCPVLYQEAITILRPALSDAQYRAISGDSVVPSIELADVCMHASVVQELTALLDSEQGGSIRFPWSLVRNHFGACFILVSRHSIEIRPLIAPTHTHAPFAGAQQRIYMSATLSGEADLLRSYGVLSIKVIQAQHPQWGKRYIFAPGLYMKEEVAYEHLMKVFVGQDVHRALILAPSYREADRMYSIFQSVSPPPTKYTAGDIENSLSVFTDSENAVLALGGRYDGIDLPGDHCRLLIMCESPGAVGALERHQREHWKLGPLLRRRERTRLIQGMGRCTRDATDFAVIMLIGQSIIDAICTPTLVDGLPGEIQREIQWGRTQGDTARDDPDALTRMILGIMTDPEYRQEANESMEDVEPGKVAPEPKSYQDSAKREVRFSMALWEGDHTRAYEVAKEASDAVSGPELAGYRAWWLYLGAIAAFYDENAVGAIDCLDRAKSVGINSGFLSELLRARRLQGANVNLSAGDDAQAEAVWNYIDKCGWHGLKFGTKIEKMIQQLGELSNPTVFHMGIEALGQCLGAETIRSTEDGAPDVVWVFQNQCFTVEAKSGKKPENALSKDNVIEANGHPDWLRAHRADLIGLATDAVVVAPNIALDEVAKPFANKLMAISTADVLALAQEVATALKSIRTEFSGKEYGQVLGQFKSRLKERGLLISTVSQRFVMLAE